MESLKEKIQGMAKSGEIMWYVSLVYTMIPLVTNWQTPHFLIVLVTTLLFIGAYLGIIYTKRQTIEWLGWLYITGYILIYSYRSLGTGMFLFYQTNLMTFRFREKYSSLKWLMIYGEVVFIFVRVIQIENIEGLFVLLPAILFAFGLHFAMKQELEQQVLKEKIFKQHESIHMLMAENERNRISGDLHDTLGHVFAMLTIKSELALAYLEQENMTGAKNEILDLQNISKKTTKNVRDIIQHLQQQTIMDELAMSQQILQLANIELTVQGLEIANDELEQSQQHVLSMIVRELVTNIVKHSQATECQIVFSRKQDMLCLEVRDNGIGVQEVTGDELHSVKLRLSAVKGTIYYLEYKPLHIKIEIPLAIRK